MYRQTPRTHQDSLRPPKLPDRPLVPYMRFSKKMWPKVRAENPEAPLWDLGRLIGQLWNGTAQSEKSVYQQEYEQEKADYEKAMKQYNTQYTQYMTAKSRAKTHHAPAEKGGGASRSKAGGGTSSADAALSGVFMQPIEEEDPFELAGKRMAAIRYDRNNRLMAELFSPAYLPDPRAFVPQQRIDHFRKQRQSLEQHQQKSNEELARLEELFNARKRAIQRDAEAHQEALKRACEERPRVDSARCAELTEQYKEQLLHSWEQYQQRQAAIQAKLEADRRANPVLAELISKSPAQESEELVKEEEGQPMEEEKKDEELAPKEENGEAADEDEDGSERKSANDGDGQAPEGTL